jgi:eukaryotic-like serine/threonine-protein kinase
METSRTKRFGRYEVVSELGRGAMGVVYKARDPQIDRFVAIKTISLPGQDLPEQEEFRMRFMNEAQAAGRLHHPGIVSIFDVGENPDNHNPYIVLEYVAGEALNKILAREKVLPPEKALKLAEQVAEALHYAHAQGVIHRDIKPGNILVTEDGQAKIADFGIAKLNLAHFTLPGRVLGTPAYMAPEQLSGEGVDGRSDLFSLGVILYAMVTGHSPFQGNSETTVCFKIANREPIAPSALNLNLPLELDAVIARAMAKDPDNRYATGAEFAEDLRRLQVPAADSPTGARRTGGTTTSLRAITSTALRPGTQAGRIATTQAAASRRAARIAQVRANILNAPTGAMIAGAGILLALVITQGQWKLLITSSRNGTASNLATPLVMASAAVPAKALQESSNSAGSSAASPAVRSAHGAPTEAASVRATRANARTATHHAKVPACSVDLEVKHQFVDATLYLWMDDKLVLTRPLHGGAQKHLVVFNDVRGVDSETVSIPEGQHVLRFRALTADRTTDLSKSLSAEFIAGDSRSLLVTFDKHNTAMRVAWK